MYTLFQSLGTELTLPRSGPPGPPRPPAAPAPESRMSHDPAMLRCFDASMLRCLSYCHTAVTAVISNFGHFGHFSHFALIYLESNECTLRRS